MEDALKDQDILELDKAGELLEKIVRKLTNGKCGTIFTAENEDNVCDNLYVARFGIWRYLTPGGFESIWWRFAKRLWLDIDTYIKTNGKELPIETLSKKEKYKILAENIRQEATAQKES